MIKLLASLLLIIVIVPKTHAVAIDRSKIKEYYRLKNEAELKIVDSSYSEALVLYKQAFSYKFPNPRDLYNAFIIAYRLKDTAACKQYYNILAELGTDRKKFEELPFVADIKDDKFYLKDIVSDQEYYNLKYQLSARPSVALILDSLYAVDQFYRGYYPPAVWLSHDIANVNYLCDYIQKNGFPGFEQAGVKQGKLSVPYNCGTIQLIHWHIRGTDTTVYTWVKIFDSILYQAVLDGRYDPTDYALTVDHLEPYYYEQLQPIRQMLSKEGLDLTKLDISDINTRRARLYLEPLEDYIRKWKFELTDNNFYFFGPYVSVNNQKTIQKMLRDEVTHQ